MAELTKDHVVRMIQGIMRQHGWSASRVAREAGVSPSTVTRALDPKSEFMPSGTTLSKLTPLLASATLKAKFSLDHTIDEVTTLFSTRTALETGTLPIVGTIQAGVWKEEPYVAPTDRAPLTIIDREWIEMNPCAFEIVGDDTDRDLPSGSIVIVARDNYGANLDGDIAVVRRSVHFLGSAKYETTLWDVREAETGLQLLPRSKTPSDPLPLDKAMGSAAEPLGVVVATYQRLKRRIPPTNEKS